MTQDSSRKPLRQPEFRPGLILDRLLDPALSGRLTCRALSKLAGKEELFGSRMYCPADVRVIRQAFARLSGAAGAHALRIVALRSFRRRSGKSIIAANLAVALAFMGHRVLCLDADPQGDLSVYLGGMREGSQVPVHLGTVLAQFLRYSVPVALESVMVPVFAGGMLDLLPGSAALELLEMQLTMRDVVPGLLARLVPAHPEFFSRYDVLLVDCAPGSGRLPTAFTTGTGAVLMPVRPDHASLLAAGAFAAEAANMAGGESAVNLVPLANGYTPGSSGVTEQLAALASAVYPWLIDETVLPLCRELARGSGGGDNAPRLVVEADPAGDVAQQFYGLARSVLARCGVMALGRVGDLAQGTS